MPDINRVLLNLLPQLCQAPGDPNRWSGFMESLMKSTGAVQGLFIHHDANDRRTDLASGFNLDMHWAAAYQSYYKFKTPYLNVHLSELPGRGPLLISLPS